LTHQDIVNEGRPLANGPNRYLEIDRTIQLTIIDADRTIGGVWSADRIYPGLVADSPVGLFDFSDLPMEEALGLKNWTDIPARKVHEYLDAYANKYGLTERIKLSTKVSNVKRNPDSKGWDLEIESSGEVLSCDKLIVATGLTSEPNWPDIPRDNFNGIVMHCKSVAVHNGSLTSRKVNQVTVYGGCKSGIDAVILCLTAGKKVNWVIRDKGNGPGIKYSRRFFGIRSRLYAL
jgi:cation diffusion facilitator CzcD-associated flavoprotein CzcO